jgi:hypothetical protein
VTNCTRSRAALTPCLLTSSFSSASRTCTHARMRGRAKGHPCDQQCQSNENEQSRARQLYDSRGWGSSRLAIPSSFLPFACLPLRASHLHLAQLRAVADADDQHRKRQARGRHKRVDRVLYRARAEAQSREGKGEGQEATVGLLWSQRTEKHISLPSPPPPGPSSHLHVVNGSVREDQQHVILEVQAGLPDHADHGLQQRGKQSGARQLPLREGLPASKRGSRSRW